MSSTSGRGNKPWLARATNQFARTVHAELRRAGHGKGDIVRFINELMDLLTKEGDQVPESPALVDSEAGLPSSDSMLDIVDFELRIQPKDRREDERLAILVIDVVLPGWITDAVRQRTHELLYQMVSQGLRARDSLGQLGPDRYLLVLPRSKDPVFESIKQRIVAALKRTPELPESLVLELRSVITSRQAIPTSAIELLQQCFAQPSEQVRVPDQVASSVPVLKARDGRSSHGGLVLALGGGAARAVSHAGMLSVLTRAGIKPLAIAGCSAGAVVGAMVARGLTPDTIIARFTEFSRTDLYLQMRRAYAEFLRQRRTGGRSRSRYFGMSTLAFHSDTSLSALPSEQLHAFVEHFLGADCDIASLTVPFAVVATDLVEGRAVKLSHGSLHAAVAASCAVPGLFPPQREGERLLVDGSTVTEVPIWAAHLIGVSAPVLAVYMGRPFHRITDYQTSSEVTSRSHALIHSELVREQLRTAELLLTIPMEEIGWLDFRRAGEIVELGRQATEAALPGILAYLEGNARR